VEKSQILAITIAILSFIYWNAFILNAYYTFQYATDLSTYLISFHYFVEYPKTIITSFAVFGNHFAPDQLLVLPFYALIQSPLTLLFAQSFVIAITALAVFFIAKDLLESGYIAIVLEIAFLLNAGVHGMLIFDYHAEMFIMLAYLLTFYFYMKSSTKLFVISLFFLLFSIEVASVLAITMGLGLLCYEYLNKTNSKRIRLAWMMIVISVIAILGENALYYATLGKPTGQPAFLSFLNGTGEPLIYPISLASISNATNLSLMATTIHVPSASNIFYDVLMVYISIGIYGLALVYIGFGIVAINYNKVTTLILTSQWLVVVFLLRDLDFALPSYQYYSFVIGGILVATILGYMIAKSKNKNVNKLALSALILAITLQTPNMILSFISVTSPVRATNYSQLHSIINQVPENAPVMAQFFVVPFLSNRQYVEGVTNLSHYFTPEYIVLDYDPNVSVWAPSAVQYYWVKTYMANSSYVLYARNGTAMLYKKD